MNETKYLEISNEDDLRWVLTRFGGIPVDRWGSAGAKSVSDLMEEIKMGESFLHMVKGCLVRVTERSVVDIWLPQGRSLLHLRERGHELPGGGIKPVHRAESLSRKKRLNESPEETARRGMREELGIAGGFSLFFLERKSGDSRLFAGKQAYPYLSSFRITNHFICQLPKALRKKSYRTEHNGCTLVFEWEKVEPDSKAAAPYRAYLRGSP
ncbi:MAG: NUDIX domain-containing protein [Patescibacteria group bacterium]|nr:NUDIX domain-containing protein [Patescibacteria group bacterium]